MKTRNLFLAGTLAVAAIALAPKFFTPAPVKAAGGGAILTGDDQIGFGRKAGRRDGIGKG